jgi:predicted Zn-dependent peptidase
MIDYKQYPYNYATLKNGIRLVHRYTPSQVAHLGVTIDVGSRDEKSARKWYSSLH